MSLQGKLTGFLLNQVLKRLGHECVVTLGLLVIAIALMPVEAKAVSKTSQGSGNWNAITWSPAGVPAVGDDVTIRAGDTVTLNVTTALNSLTVNGILTTAQTLNVNNIATAFITVNNGGRITVGNDNTNRIVNVTGDLTVNTGGVFNTGGNGGNTLNLGGDLINDGTFDMRIGTATLNTTFNGSANQTVSGTGGTTDFNLIVINNTGAAGNDIVEVASSNFTTPVGFLTLTNGTFKISGSFTFANTFFNGVAYTIAAGNQLWLNNPNVTVTAQGGGDAILTGTIRVSSGTYNVGTADGDGLEYNSGATLQVEGGTINFASRFRGVAAANTLTFNMSGGTINVNTVSNSSSRPSLAIESAGSSFTMSGGTIVFPHANTGNGISNGGEYQNIAGTVNITGGLLQFGNASTLAGTDDAFILGLSGTNIAPSLSIVDNATSVPVLSLGAALSVRGDVTINTGTTLGVNTQAVTVTGNSASNPGNWTNNGTFTVGTQTISFTGIFAAQTISGSTSTAFNSLTIANTGSGFTNMTTSGSVAATLTLTSDLRVTSSAVLTATGSTSTGNGDVIGTVTRTDNNGTAISFGNVNVQITRTVGTDTTFSVNFDNQAPPDFGNAVRRTYTLTPGAAITATVRLRYLDNATELNGNAEASLQLWRKGATWTAQGGTADSVNNYVTLAGVTTFSPWTIAGPTGPTAVRLKRFSATSFVDGVVLQWESGFEVNNLGYHIYREEKGRRVRITPSVVAGSALAVGPGSRLTAGYAYAWFDANGSAGSNYYLEAIDLNGERTVAGPVSVMRAEGTSSRTKRALLLSELSDSRSQRAPETSWPSALKDQPRGEILRPKPGFFTTQQIIAAGPAVKLQVRRSGWYRVNAAELFAAGLDANVNAHLLHLFVDGSEVPIKLSTEGVRLDPSDTLEFFGVALDTTTTDTRTYWLVTGETAGRRISSPKRIRTKPGEIVWTDNNIGTRSFNYTVERREKLAYFSNLLNGEAENIFGSLVTTEPTLQTITVRNMEREASGSPQVEIALQGITTGQHQVQVALNGMLLGTINFDDRQHPVERFSVDRSLVRDGENAISLVTSGNEADVSFVDWVRLTYAHRYVPDNNALSFSLSGGQAVYISGFSSPNVRVIDITDPNAVLEVPVVAGSVGSSFGVRLQTSGSAERTFIASVDDLAQHPAAVIANQPSNWHDATNAADMVIITHKAFRSGIEPLVSLRRNQGLSVAVVDVEDIYDEFAYGTHTPIALKNFLSWAATHWSRKPQYLLLVGDSSWDPRNYLDQGDNDFVPTKLLDTSFMETASDDWFVDFEGTGFPDMAVGRLPVRSAAQLDLLVTKILAYEAERELGTPLRGALLVSDTGFEWQNVQVQPLMLPNMQVETINRGQINNDDETRAQIMERLNIGPMVVNYFGHGSNQVWTGADLLNIDGVANLANGSRLSIFVMMTCLNGYAHDVYIDSLGEAALNAANGGAVAVWASTGFTEPQPQFALNTEFYRQLFGGQPLRLGDAVRNAKQSVDDTDVRRTWILLGDPAMKIR